VPTVLRWYNVWAAEQWSKADQKAESGPAVDYMSQIQVQQPVAPGQSEGIHHQECLSSHQQLPSQSGLFTL